MSDEKQDPTICAECRFCRHDDVRMTFICDAPSEQVESTIVNFVTGHRRFIHLDGDREIIYFDDGTPNCEWTNFGACESFEAGANKATISAIEE